jgi:hypothetical protein
MSALDQLKSSSNETTFNSLIANKLNVNKEIYFESGN